MLFTIIIPVYNVELYLRECIESVLNQTYDDLEVIIINDGSTDDSLYICHEFEKNDSRIKVVNKENFGLSCARNEGLQLANGNFVMFLDSDDYLFNNTVIQSFVDIFKYKECDLIYGTYTGFLEKNNGTVRFDIDEKKLNINNEQIANLNSEAVFRELFRSKSYISSATTKIYKKSVLDDSNIRFKEGIYHEDEEWTPKVILNSKKIFIYEKKFYMRRYREDSIMTSRNEKKIMKRIVDRFCVADIMINYFTVSSFDPKLVELANAYFGSFIISNIILYKELENTKNSQIIKNEIDSKLYLFNYLKDYKYKAIYYIYKLFGIDSAALVFNSLKKIKSSLM